MTTKSKYGISELEIGQKVSFKDWGEEYSKICGVISRVGKATGRRFSIRHVGAYDYECIRIGDSQQIRRSK